jgi:hypothetical protein
VGVNEALFGKSAGSEVEPSGWLHIVRCEPDPFAGEILNIGVFGVARDGRRHAKFVEQPGRLECLYGDGAHRVVSMARAAFAASLVGDTMPSPQLSIQGPMPFFHVGVEEAVERAFSDLVTVALPLREVNREARPPRLTDDQALANVSNALKLLLNLDLDILASTPNVIVQTDRGAWPLFVPLQPPQGVGTVRSADYAADTLRFHLVDSILNIECAASQRNKRGMGLFILRPQSVRRDDVAEIDEVIDSIYARAPKQLRLEVSQDANELALAVADWGDHLR